jgi:Fe-S cluster assembly ATP-binding protein
MLQINNLHANVGDKPILKGLTLSLGAVEARKLLGISLEGSVG